MLSRTRNKLGIWFKDEPTKRYVMEYLGLNKYAPEEIPFNAPDDKNSLLQERDNPEVSRMTRTIRVVYQSRRNHGRHYARIDGDDGNEYTIPDWEYELIHDSRLRLQRGKRIRFDPVEKGRYKNAKNIVVI